MYNGRQAVGEKQYLLKASMQFLPEFFGPGEECVWYERAGSLRVEEVTWKVWKQSTDRFESN